MHFINFYEPPIHISPAWFYLPFSHLQLQFLKPFNPNSLPNVVLLNCNNCSPNVNLASFIVLSNHNNFVFFVSLLKNLVNTLSVVAYVCIAVNSVYPIEATFCGTETLKVLCFNLNKFGPQYVFALLSMVFIQWRQLSVAQKHFDARSPVKYVRRHAHKANWGNDKNWINTILCIARHTLKTNSQKMHTFTSCNSATHPLKRGSY